MLRDYLQTAQDVLEVSWMSPTQKEKAKISEPKEKKEGGRGGGLKIQEKTWDGEGRKEVCYGDILGCDSSGFGGAPK